MIRIYFRDAFQAEATAQPDGSVRLHGPGAAAAAKLVRHYADEAAGEDLLRLLLKRLRGQWWAEAVHRRGGDVEPMAEDEPRDFGKAQTNEQSQNYQRQHDREQAAARTQRPAELPRLSSDDSRPAQERPMPARPAPPHPKIENDPQHGDYVAIDAGGRPARAYRPRSPTDYNQYHARAGYDPFEDRSPERAAHLAEAPTADDYEEQRNHIIEERYEQLRDQYLDDLQTDWNNQNGEEPDDYAWEAMNDEASQAAYEAARGDENHIDWEYNLDRFRHLPVYYLQRDPDFTALYEALKRNPHRPHDQLAMNDWLEEHGLDRFKFYFDDDEDHPRARPFDENERSFAKAQTRTQSQAYEREHQAQEASRPKPPPEPAPEPPVKYPRPQSVRYHPDDVSRAIEAYRREASLRGGGWPHAADAEAIANVLNGDGSDISDGDKAASRELWPEHYGSMPGLTPEEVMAHWKHWSKSPLLAGRDAPPLPPEAFALAQHLGHPEKMPGDPAGQAANWRAARRELSDWLEEQGHQELAEAVRDDSENASEIAMDLLASQKERLAEKVFKIPHELAHEPDALEYKGRHGARALDRALDADDPEHQQAAWLFANTGGTAGKYRPQLFRRTRERRPAREPDRTPYVLEHGEDAEFRAYAEALKRRRLNPPEGPR